MRRGEPEGKNHGFTRIDTDDGRVSHGDHGGARPHWRCEAALAVRRQKLATKMHTMHKGIGLNRQEGAKVSEEDLPRTHAALTGICRSGGLVDTLIREFIRVSRCPPIHARMADSAACHITPINFLSCFPWRLGGLLQSGLHTRLSVCGMTLEVFE